MCRLLSRVECREKNRSWKNMLMKAEDAGGLTFQNLSKCSLTGYREVGYAVLFIIVIGINNIII
ncbi:hypothetical protein PK28_13355 [Hymenobacter sp. DG25B]|nr:hypothetical protein PK28_13355 [Hymenobacter sp. DG25B]